MFIFTIIVHPVPVLFSDPYPASLKQIISDQGRSRSGSKTLLCAPAPITVFL
jgi:hypothetical protein